MTDSSGQTRKAMIRLCTRTCWSGRQFGYTKAPSLYDVPQILTQFLDSILKAPSKICNRRHSEICIFYVSEKTSLEISCELSAWQMIHMKCQDMFFFSEKKTKKQQKSTLSSALVVIGALRVKGNGYTSRVNYSGMQIFDILLKGVGGFS